MQSGMYDGLWIAFVLFGLFCAALGWGVIEGALWVANHIDVNWVTP